MSLTDISLLTGCLAMGGLCIGLIFLACRKAWKRNRDSDRREWMGFDNEEGDDADWDPRRWR